MAKKTIEEYKNDLDDRLNSLVRKRNDLVLEVDKIGKDIQLAMEQRLALDETRVRVYCLPAPLGCDGKGYLETDDGKKQMCPICGGPDKPYIWAKKYVEPSK